MYSYMLSPDGREFYFFKRVGSAAEDYRIFRSTRTDSGWTDPEQVSLGGDYSDLYPTLSPDGSRLVFSSYRPAPGDTSSHPNAHIWMSGRQESGWSTPEFVAASRLGYYHSGLRQDRSGTLRFRLTSPDWREASEVELRWNGKIFESAIRPVAPSPAIDYWRRQAGDTLFIWGEVVGPNSVTLLSISRVTQPGDRRSPAQYFVTRPRAGGWTPLARAGGGLGEGSPNFAWFSPDGCYVHYTRNYTEFMRVPLRDVLIPTS
jgi:hypothetical protein